MGAEIVNFSGGVLTLKVSGRLTQGELATAQKAAGEIIEKHGKCSILVLTENFAGWERGGQWEDQSFQDAHDASIASRSRSASSKRPTAPSMSA
jgi:hypothetical protein